MIVVMFIVMFVLFLLTVPVAVSLGLASSITILGMNMPAGLVAQRFFTGLNSFTLLAIPFFILAGALMESTGISKRIVDFVSSMVGHYHGGLATILIISCMFFGALSGSAAATAAAIGSIMIPSMVKRGYDVRFSAATQASAAGLAVIIPPSISMILYCVATNVSITDMFVAGVVPGILLGLTEILYAWYVCRKKGYTGDKKHTWKERGKSFKDAIWALFMPVIILGGIYGGFFTATEASAVAVAYAILVGFVIYKELTWKKLMATFAEAAILVAVIMLVLSTADLFAYVLTSAQIPNKVAEWFIGIAGNKYLFLIMINIFLFIVGMFFDPGPGMIILAPILMPAAVALGIDPIHFGIIMVINFSIGAITPPFAVNLFVSSQVAGIKYEEIVKPILPYIGLLVVDLLVISYVPPLSLILPNLLK
ncbi:TRAP transporter large permease [Cuneatibacter sp. NSJ-177]|jgi:C4-dicarboxylate transporter DctM subunit|uniref:TRAP transporter large permease n=1 Tax=Cuneatibacter sp. NSJ-177 TaxID=2931401 RepID=UPI001FD5E302|nr:TRAP transporter large permease [Cuneatibacter sp. NSJ-177]MCJ7835287.1 TRAP transporter large permease [Cuneatibacter sp. NSJ-177]